MVDYRKKKKKLTGKSGGQPAAAGSEARSIIKENRLSL
jgi:hypothetical protein